VVLTRAESESIDLDSRMTFASAVSESVLPFARSRSDFAGAYIDQAAGGRLVVLFTGADDRRDAKLRALEPNPSLDMIIREVTHPYAALRHAVESMPEAWTSVYGELVLMCESQPVLLVQRTGNDRLAIHLDHGPSPDSCAAAGIDYRVVLHLDRPVSLEAIEATETSPSAPAD